MEHYVNINDVEHEIRVANLCIKIAKPLNFSENNLNILYISAILHDIGKAFISKSILNKPDKLSFLERKEIEKHSFLGYKEILKNNYPLEIALNVLYHHENFDGSGYPSGLKEIYIPCYSRIIRIADFYDALTSDRPYREKLNYEDALFTMNDNKHVFDPKYYDIFLRTIKSNYKNSLTYIKLFQIY